MNYEITKHRFLIVDQDLIINIQQISYIRYLYADKCIRIKCCGCNDSHYVKCESVDEFLKLIKDIN